MKRRPQSTEGIETYEAIAAALAGSGAVSARMFGMPTLKVGGKAFAGYGDGYMTFKLAGAEHARALALPGAALFDPSGRGRPMKEWVEVPAVASGEWEALARAALAYVGATA